VVHRGINLSVLLEAEDEGGSGMSKKEIEWIRSFPENIVRLLYSSCHLTHDLDDFLIS
jgi:hypothetical protein